MDDWGQVNRGRSTRPGSEVVYYPNVQQSGDYSGSEAKAHGFSRGMKPTTGKQTTDFGLPDIPTF
jgi:hypothetical protein